MSLIEICSILGGKKTNQKYAARPQSGSANLKDPLKRRPKGISNARLKSHWEKKKRPKKKQPMVEEKIMEDPSSTQMNFSSMPECFSEEYITGHPTSQPGAEYTRLMMDFINSELKFNQFSV
ncbi:hypothetical protein IEQ34_018748 [Dendrobium chrysotoxum]|uniref:Uncharacterized protein n=1 Tax=Dendrobium chrysotoxum TaxID=161865 RepID=A0AAV7G663_DENCH|nr:hypothetical protein IEQ34_018748 [Dendrobium chrysotoxum]